MTSVASLLVKYAPKNSTMNGINSSGNNTIIGGDGDDTIISFGGNCKIDAGKGNDKVGHVGNNADIKMGDGNDKAVVWSNNSKIDLGNGNDSFKTLDLAIKSEKLKNPSFIDDTVKYNTTTSKNTSSKTYSETSSKTTKGASATQTTITAKARDGKVYTYKYTGSKHKDGRLIYKSTKKATMGSNYLYIKADDVSKNANKTTTTTNNYKATTTSTTATTIGTTQGCNNLTITGGNGNDSIQVKGANNYISGGKGNDRIFSLSNVVSNSSKTTSKTSKQLLSSNTSSKATLSVTGHGGDYVTGSPLILDTNKDGKVSAAHGKGVDVNGDGKADGAAVDGDKMLAMGDIDGDGKITGAEVFGNETVNPFTGEKLNAKNGFEALKMVAEEVEKRCNINCIENGKVNVQKLKKALESLKVASLGMISGNNVTKLESLGDVKTINVNNYVNQKQEGNVQHNQLGSYTTTSGEKHKVHDVWFTL